MQHPAARAVQAHERAALAAVAGGVDVPGVASVFMSGWGKGRSGLMASVAPRVGQVGKAALAVWSFRPANVVCDCTDILQDAYRSDAEVRFVQFSREGETRGSGRFKRGLLGSGSASEER